MDFEMAPSSGVGQGTAGDGLVVRTMGDWVLVMVLARAGVKFEKFMKFMSW